MIQRVVIRPSGSALLLSLDDQESPGPVLALTHWAQRSGATARVKWAWVPASTQSWRAHGAQSRTPRSMESKRGQRRRKKRSERQGRPELVVCSHGGWRHAKLPLIPAAWLNLAQARQRGQWGTWICDLPMRWVSEQAHNCRLPRPARRTVRCWEREQRLKLILALPVYLWSVV